MADTARLVQLLLGMLEQPSEPDWDVLRAQADPAGQATAWTLLLQTILKRGPGPDQISPSSILGLADRAAQLGVLPLSAPTSLRALLDDLVEALHGQGAWRTEVPLYWAPLPERGPAERRWRGTLARIDWPEPTRLKGVFDPDTDLPCLLLPQFLAPELLDPIATRLEAAYRAGHLALEAEGVGEDARLTDRRNDRVTYLNGHEPELLAQLPELAALIQALLHRLPECLRPGWPGPLHAPGRVMLARYEGPSRGYRMHVDNPGGANENGRSLSFTLYLQQRDQPCVGGELAIWPPTALEREPLRQPCTGGQAVIFDARRVPHQVCALEVGPPRWTLVLWLNAEVQHPPQPALPKLDPLDVLMPLAQVPLPAGQVLFHELGETLRGRLSLWRPQQAVRVALVATVYRAQALLPAFCAHHLALGIETLILVFDHLEEPEEQDLAERLRQQFGPAVNIWSGAETARIRWPRCPADPRIAALPKLADLGANVQGLCARQTLNATAALQAVQAGAFGAIDWLVHLDADEFLYCDGRSGSRIDEAFAAATAAGWSHLRLLNHELLLGATDELRFKLNPRLALARLGERGWSETVRALRLEQEGPRPWFTGYFNGKGAVSVRAARLAAGVHGFFLEGETLSKPVLLAGPVILHFHNADSASFRRKYLAIAAAPQGEDRMALFEISAVEERARACIAAAREDGADLATRLDLLYRRMTHYSDAELDLLDGLGLILTPKLDPLPGLPRK